MKLTPAEQQAQRKRAHLAIAEKLYREHPQGNADFQQVRLLHPEFPELSQTEINLKSTLFGKPVSSPFYINAMTGGTTAAQKINQKLAQLAQHFQMPMAVGSMSILKSTPQAAASFQVVRQENPDGLIFANLGANHPVDFAQEMIQLLQADALQIHLNAPQEFAMAEGDQDFHWFNNFQELQKQIGPVTPLIAKEVGFGMSSQSIKQLLSLDIAGIDLSGASSTDFIAIENERRSQRLSSDYSDFGLSIVESLLNYLSTQQTAVQADQPTIFASGGIRTPWEAAKAFSLGANYVGMSAYFLHLALHHDLPEMIAIFDQWLAEFKGILLMFGCPTPAVLAQTPLILGADLMNYVQQLDLDWSQYSTNRQHH
ncbi:type 2 isopentenyl-diphosphate Delta-isomerase [Lapidilactobacillus wuchangensis]|uniref:type 2 isopentenyl-diphosphate Delta-isomerase n=1 Tax=Lapidilactobacillus wuchangensis TaxID=2486001 RepID=UPI000F785AE5|nr:type 2 isopentenyl-diphosphate Delta-isomerase [Lapidilactobacillus wuchangensis]